MRSTSQTKFSFNVLARLLIAIASSSVSIIASSTISVHLIFNTTVTAQPQCFKTHSSLLIQLLFNSLDASLTSLLIVFFISFLRLPSQISTPVLCCFTCLLSPTLSPSADTMPCTSLSSSFLLSVKYNRLILSNNLFKCFSTE